MKSRRLTTWAMSRPPAYPLNSSNIVTENSRMDDDKDDSDNNSNNNGDDLILI
jgi:hypothetical protein